MSKFSSYKNQQLLTESWRKYSSNDDLKPSDLINFLINEAVISSPEKLIVPSYEQGEGSFCKVNKQINEYASSAPENLALTIIFVIASQQVNWPVLMAGFGDLADFIETPASKKQVFVSKQGPFVKTWDGFIGASKEETIFPENVGPIVVGKTKAIHNIWMNRDEIFSVIEPLINDYNDSTGLRREDAAFDLYKALLGLQRLGIPKAGFTLQLLIGRYGCIDSINTQLYKNLIPPNLVDPKTNRFLSGSKGKQISPAFSKLTPSLLKIANAYRQFVEVIEAETKNDVSKQLWNTWCDIVAHKINYAGKVKYKSQFDVESPIGAGKVKYDYPTKFASGSERQKYYQLFKNKIGGETVGAQHYIPTIRDLSKQLKLKNLNLKEDSFSSYEKEQVLFENFRNFLDEESEFEGAELDDGTPVCVACLEELLYSERTIIQEAKYQGRTVTLNKPMKGDVKKFKVYVKDPKTGNVKKVNFGDPNMRIKKSNPKRRKSFRARHHCDTNPGPKTKARYWSCRKW